MLRAVGCWCRACMLVLGACVRADSGCSRQGLELWGHHTRACSNMSLRCPCRPQLTDTRPHARRRRLQVDFKLEQASLSGGFRVDVRLASKKDGGTIQAAVGHARNKQAGKQVAAAALLEALLAGGEVDEGALLEPAAGKEEGKKKKWQVGGAAGQESAGPAL